MRRNGLRLLVDSMLLGAALLTFASGLALLVAFHADDGATRSSALGLGRLAWLNLHRLPALLTLAALAAHLALTWRPFTTRLRGIFRRDRGPRAVLDSLLCLALLVAAAAGLATWLFVDGSAPLFGPAPLGRAAGARHALIEVHEFAGLIAFPCAARHVVRRWRWMVRSLRLY